MHNPVFVDCPADQWTKVATAVKKGQLWKANTTTNYLQTYKLTGEAAPIDSCEGMKLFADGKDYDKIEASKPIDVHVFAVGAAGRVRVDA